MVDSAGHLEYIKSTHYGGIMRDVVAVDIETGKVVQLLGTNKTLANAESIVEMAVARRGINECFFAEVFAGKLNVGDMYIREGLWVSRH